MTVIQFPNATAGTPASPPGFLSESAIKNYMVRHPDRIESMTQKLSLATRAALILKQLVHEINDEMAGEMDAIPPMTAAALSTAPAD